MATTEKPKPLRRCVLGCGLILDDHAPLIAGGVGPVGSRKTRAHCPSPACNWCQQCMQAKGFRIEADARDAGGQPESGELPPDPMT